MGGKSTRGVVLLSWVLVLLLQITTSCFAWDTNGHSVICSLARPMLTAPTMAKINTLMNSQFQHNFSTLCTWGEEVQYQPQYSWSPPLHFVNTPDNVCNYNYTRGFCNGNLKWSTSEGDCVSIFGVPNFCATGAVKNYTAQLTNPNSPYNKTESLLFLSNILGDVHQPLRCGFVGDGGGSFIDVWWLNTRNGSKTNLFSVWDSGIVHEEYELYFNQSNPTYNETLVDILGNMSLAIYSNLTAADVAKWSSCPAGSPSCPDMFGWPSCSRGGAVRNQERFTLENNVHFFYAAESVQLACQYAYAGVTADQILTDEYFSLTVPVVEQRLLQAGVRLAATLNRIFDPNYSSPPLSPAPAPPATPTPRVSPVPSVSMVPDTPAPELGTPILTPLPSKGA